MPDVATSPPVISALSMAPLPLLLLLLLALESTCCEDDSQEACLLCPWLDELQLDEWTEQQANGTVVQRVP